MLNLLDLVYYDVCGPIKVEFLDDNKFFLLLLVIFQENYEYFIWDQKTSFLALYEISCHGGMENM